VVQTIDIRGQLREGVSRKIENTIYVVSYYPRTYYWGWRPDPDQMKEQAWVYSFNVANPQQVTKAGELQIFEGGSVSIQDAQGGYYYDKSFQSVALSATANALMVAENWSINAYTSGGVGGSKVYSGCGSYNSTQLARVSLIDISDPSGKISLHARFETPGTLTDQFKMTYVNDPAANTGTFYGIFARQVWSSSNCQGGSFTQNALESWDVSVKGAPKRLDDLAFGKPNELVRGTAFDTDRKVAYAITAQRIDPMYALGFENRADLKKLSEIDGLSGDMSVFRLVGDKKFLLAVGTDASDSCTGFQDGMGWQPTKIAVSLIDVRDLAHIGLVQRKCVAVKNADWIGSDVTRNLDQAHKMLGMHSDGTVNVITVPVYYTKRVGAENDWWYGYRWETAVGLMTWDLQKYNPAVSPEQQTVIQNFGTFVHPHGEVKRSIVFTHEGTQKRMMINLSDTHVSVADLSDMSNPAMQAEIEVAPFYNQIYSFGSYLVEQVQAKPNAWGNPAQDVVTFRVKKAGGNADEAPVLASFDIGRVYRTFKHTDSLVLFRQVSDGKVDQMGNYIPPSTEAVVVDLRNPAAPRLAGRVTVPVLQVPFYRFWCGMGAYWGGFWFDEVENFALTERGLAFQVSEWRYENNQGFAVNKLVFLDLRDPDAPKVSEETLPATNAYEWGAFGMVADPVAPQGFYVSYRKALDQQTTPEGIVYSRYKYYAQRWEPEGDRWVARHDINTPGRLIRTWKSGAGDRMFLSQDNAYRKVTDTMNNSSWVSDYRLSLLRSTSVNGKPAAELLANRVLTDLYPGGLMIEGDKLLLNVRPQVNVFWGASGGGGVAVPVATPRPAVGALLADNASSLPSWETTSDRLMIFDLAAGKLNAVYDQPTRMYNMQLMGTHQGKLFINLAGNPGYYYDPFGVGGGGDGILVVDIANPAAPRGIRFLRTLGFATHIEFFGDDIYVAAGHFGLFHLDLKSSPEIPAEQ
jgi:hypothetical protein